MYIYICILYLDCIACNNGIAIANRNEGLPPPTCLPNSGTLTRSKLLRTRWCPGNCAAAHIEPA